MARTDNFTNFATDVADSIRSMTGKTGKIPASQFDTEIKSIETSENLTEELNTYETEVTDQSVSIDEIIDALKGKGSGSGAGFKLQDKSITITENGTRNIVADEGFDGLNNVEVVTKVAGSGGDLPEKCIEINKWNTNGYPTEMTVYGISSLSSYAFGSNSSSYVPSVSKHLTKINLPSETTSIGTYAFQYLTNLQTLTTSNSDNPFENITVLSNSAFSYCAALDIPGLCLPNVTTLTASGSDYSIFRNCSKIKAVWVGENISKIGKWTFAYMTGLKKIYVNQTRTELESTSSNGLSFGFSNGTLTSSDIICKDEAGFLTREQFDAIDWATYTG